MISRQTCGSAIIAGFDTDFDEIQNKIKARKRPPTKEQLTNLESLLKGFGYKDLHIPQFESVSAMELWRRRKIKEKLGVN